MNYAGFWIRFVAYLVDNLILFIAFVGVAILLGLMGLQLAGQELIFLVVFFVYFAAMQSSARQATLGKQMVGLKVTDTNGGRISFLRALARTAATIISSLTLMIGYLLAAFTGRKQALHDMIAGTLVVRDNPGRVVLALAVVVLGPVVAVGALMTLGAGLMAGMMAGMMGEMASQTAKPPAVQVAKPAAQPAKPAAPAPTAAKPAAPAPTAAAPAKPAAPATPEAPKMAEAPKAAPMKVAAAAPLEVKEVPRPPTAQEPAKEEAKEEEKEAKEEAKEDAPAKPAAAEAAPKPAAPAAPLVPKALLSGPVIQGPKYNDLTTAVLYRDAAAVSELISYGKWADKADSTGTTPLMVAVSLGDAQIAEVLLKAGANPNKALPVAREKGNGAMASLLERYGAR